MQAKARLRNEAGSPEQPKIKFIILDDVPTEDKAREAAQNIKTNGKLDGYVLDRLYFGRRRIKLY